MVKETRTRRNWDSKLKAKIVLEAISGRPVEEIIKEYDISASQLSQWKGRFLERAFKVFELDRGEEGSNGVELSIVEENRFMKEFIAELVMEQRKQVLV